MNSIFGTMRGMIRPAAAVVVLLSAMALRAEPRLAHLFSNHAVLQRDTPIHIWGWATPDEPIRVEFHAQTRTSKANRYGEWNVWLRPEAAGGPFTLTVSGMGAPVTVTDVLVGDVWFASGQSNMEIPLRGFPGQAVIKDAAREIAGANLPTVRLLHVSEKASSFPLDDLTDSWTTCTPTTAIDFSAVAFLFGRTISQQEHVPVGLIDSTWGGTPVEAWTSLDALTADASLMPALAWWAHFADAQTRVPRVIAEEEREDRAAAQTGQPKPRHRWHPAAESWQPGALYNGMVAPVTPYAIKGVIWYQGETNSDPDRAPLYGKLFSTLIADWRRDWHEGEFPFLFVQISSFDSPEEDWGVLRDQQRRTLAVSNTAMAVSLDLGEADNVHPPDKQTVAARLVLAADAKVYGRPVEFSGPLFREATPDGGTLRVDFDHAEGLVSHHGALRGFAIAGHDRHFVPAIATLDGSSVIVRSPEVAEPEYVRYGWQNVTDANLYNAAGLPAPTFTSE